MLDRQVHIEMLCVSILRDPQELLTVAGNPQERHFAGLYIPAIHELSSQLPDIEIEKLETFIKEWKANA